MSHDIQLQFNLSRQAFERGSSAPRLFHFEKRLVRRKPVVSSAWQHENVLASAQSEFDDILVHNLHITTRRNGIAVDMGTVCAFQINQVGLDLAYAIAILISFFHVAELQCSMLLRATRVLKRKIHHLVLSADQPATPPTKLDHLKQILSLKNVKSPGLLRGRLPGLGGFVVFENNLLSTLDLDRVAFSSKSTRLIVVGLDLLRRSRVARLNVTREGICL